MAYDFNCIMKSNEDEEDSVIIDQLKKIAEQGKQKPHQPSSAEMDVVIDWQFRTCIRYDSTEKRESKVRKL